MKNIDGKLLVQLESFGTFTSRSFGDELSLRFVNPDAFDCEWTKLSLVFVSPRNQENENFRKCVELANEIRNRMDRFQCWLKQEAIERLRQDRIDVNRPSISSGLTTCTITISVYDRFDPHGWNGWATFPLTMSDDEMLVVPISFPT